MPCVSLAAGGAVDQQPGFGIALFVSGKRAEVDEVIDFSARFASRVWPTLDGAVENRILVERGDKSGSDTGVTVQRWRDRESYEAYRQGDGREPAQRIIKLHQEVEYLSPLASIGAPGEAGMHFLVRLPTGAETQRIAGALSDGLRRESGQAAGFLGAQIFEREEGDAIFGLLSWRSDDDFIGWRKSSTGQAAAAWLRSFTPRTWRLTEVTRILGLAFE
jgi:heme-degrading monooxygenase HmoA